MRDYLFQASRPAIAVFKSPFFARQFLNLLQQGSSWM
jgi:hypothetical protein